VVASPPPLARRLYGPADGPQSLTMGDGEALAGNCVAP